MDHLTHSFFQDISDVRRNFDQLFHRVMTGWPGNWEGVPSRSTLAFAPEAEAYVDKDGKKYICRFSLPGIDPKDVQIHAQGNLLAVSGERKVTRKAKDV